MRIFKVVPVPANEAKEFTLEELLAALGGIGALAPDVTGLTLEIQPATVYYPVRLMAAWTAKQ